MECDNCGKSHNRKRFCSNKCKDRYHNRENPRGIGLFQSAKEDDLDMREAALDGATGGWDEDGWRSDDSGVVYL